LFYFEIFKQAGFVVANRRRFTRFFALNTPGKFINALFIKRFSVLARVLLFDGRVQFRPQPHQSVLPPLPS
jgi:hypothetical protein